MGIRPIARRAVFLDRDGVLNEADVRDGKPYPPASAAGLRIAAGAAASLEALRRAGFLLIVVTNQPDVGRGAQDASVVEAIHAALRAALPLDDFFVCYHSDEHRCRCRKPLPGMLEDAAARYGIALGESFMVGDRWRDVDAGRAAGCRTVWIDRGYRERGPSAPADARVASLEEAAGWILQHSS